MNRLDSLDALFLDQLKDLYSAEKQVSKALPKMAKAASSEALREAFQEHMGQTQRQLERLERIFELLGQKPGRPKCQGMEGILGEGEELLKKGSEPAVRDAALIGSAQHVEHYEVAGYGTARTFAEQLGNEEAARLLQETLDEEKLTDEKLSRLAVGGMKGEAGVNEEALIATAD